MIPLLALALLAPPTAPIEGPAHLTRTFAALRVLEGRTAAGTVRVTHFGDSHVAADLWTGPMRAALQARFGDGGRGFVLAGRPWSSYFQQHMQGDADGDWRVDGLRGGLDDGWFGPGGCSMASADPRAAIRLAIPQKSPAGRGAAWIELYHLRQPGGGCLEVRHGDRPLGRVSTRGPWIEAAFARFPLPPGGAPISVHPLAGGETRLLGLDLAGGNGLVYDALGINGARITRLLQHDPQGFTELLGHLRPALVVLSYGTNELFDRDLDLAAYEADLDRAIQRVRAAAPTADCLITGPPDFARQGAPIDHVTAIQRALAEAHGCAFWDARAAMGGPGSIHAWRRAGRAQADRVHLTRDGYRALGELMVEALLAAYDQAIDTGAIPAAPGAEILPR
ncbi:MAG: hypothetical protein H6703_06155 [Myxococcales bacterium]|nr:hypothetical protein [Myxococcales bacterium]